MNDVKYGCQVDSGGAVTKEDLGRATWTFLHTLAAQVHFTLSGAFVCVNSMCQNS